MEQTAVEKLEISLLGIVSFDSEELRAKYKDRITKAKQMEKEQIIDFANNYGFDICGYDYERAEQYYNETFKTE